MKSETLVYYKYKPTVKPNLAGKFCAIPFSMIEIDGNLYYLSSMHVDQCILNFSHTMNLDLLDTIVKYATGLSDEKITTIVFKKSDLPNEEKKVVGFWHPQLCRFMIQG